MSPAHSGIQALVELARSDRVEMRPVLLRVLTDLYVQEPFHGPAEQSRFAELACRLLDSVELAVRTAVAERLADCAAVPHAVALKLARDEIDAAAPILARCAALDEKDLHAILDQNWPAHRAAIVQRANLPESIAARVRPTASAAYSPDLPRDESLTRALAWRYLMTDRAERRTIATALAICPPAGDEAKLRRTEGSVRGKLERAALQHRSAEFIALMHEHTGMPRDIAKRIVHEPSGEPLAVYCRALEMDFNAVSRIVLFLNPGTGRSMERVQELAATLDSMPHAVARRLAAAWCSLGGGLRPELARWTRTRRVRTDLRPAAARAFRGVTPARPAAASES